MLIKLIKQHLMKMTATQRLIYIVNLLWRSPYSWGHEMLGQTDCSGTISWGLYLMGFDVRITADDMQSRMTDSHIGAPRAGNLLFFWFPNQNRVRHVTLFVENDIVLNAQAAATFRRWENVVAERYDQPFEIKEINWNKVLTLSNSKEAYGVDENLQKLFGIFSLENLTKEEANG